MYPPGFLDMHMLVKHNAFVEGLDQCEAPTRMGSCSGRI